jgi:hypothetical protein
MSELDTLPVGIKAQLAVRDAQCSDPAKAALVSIFGTITKAEKKDRGAVLAVLKRVIGDDAVTDSDDVADELAQAAATLGVKAVRKSTAVAKVSEAA